MVSWVHVAAGAALMLVGWLAARWVARARSFSPVSALFLDGLVPVGTLLVLTLATGRPIFSGVVALAAFSGFAFADAEKRAILREPVVFTDLAEIRGLFVHPHLYVGHLGAGTFAAIVAVIVAAMAAIFAFDPPLFVPPAALVASALTAPVVVVTIIVMFFVPAWAELLRRYDPRPDEPAADASRFGPFAVLGIHGVIARDERNRRRGAVRPPVPTITRVDPAPPVILVQSESFFDARRLTPSLGSDLLPAFDSVRSSGLQWGRLAVPCWGANTTRTEFSVLTGLPDGAIGFDRLNPYHAFAKTPVDSIAWRLKARGYRTICVHPFDPKFYARDRIMPMLGFDRFVDEGEFAGAERNGRYVSDRALAGFSGELLRAHAGEPLFVFLITMENHGPWEADESARGELPAALSGLAEAGALGSYLRALKNAGAMVAQLTRALLDDGRSGLLGFYGDHLPSFPRTFSALGFDETATDYLIWRPGMTAARRADISANQLASAILGALPSAPGRAAAASLAAGD